MSAARSTAAQRFRIGTVTRLTALTAETLRAWERRHRAVSPQRTPGGARLYSDDDVQRLLLLKALTERGDPIGTVASLPDAALRSRLERVARPAQTPGQAPSAATRAPRIAVIDPILHTQLRTGAADVAGLEIAASAGSLEELERPETSGALDALVVGLATLGEDPPAELARIETRLSAPVTIVVYEFARRAQLVRLERRGVRLLRGPLSAHALEGAVREALAATGLAARSATPPPAEGKASPDVVPPPRFSDAQLGRLREIRSSVECECPNHLAALLLSLASFERYAAGCAGRRPEDAALHRMLARETGRARGIVESALERLCAEDGIAL